MEHSINVKVELPSIVITIDGLLHLSLERKDLYGIQSYRNGQGSYIIEYYTKSGNILTEYEDSIMWIAILTELAKYQLFKYNYVE